MHPIEAQITAVTIPSGSISLNGHLHVPPEARGLVLFAHGSGSSRHTPRNQRVAESLHDVGLATLLVDLHSASEEPWDRFTARVRLDPAALAQRLRVATRWAQEQPELGELSLGYFGANTGAAAALVAAAADGNRIGAVVTRGGRPDSVPDALKTLRVPTLLIVGGNDAASTAFHLEAWAQLRCEKSIEIIPGAGPLFEEPGALDNVAALAARWFGEHLWDDDRLNA